MPNCQIEYVSSDSDNGMPCGKTAVAKCGDCGQQSVQTAVSNAAGSHSVVSATIITSRIRA
jgi:hypothetical protein